MKNPNPH